MSLKVPLNKGLLFYPAPAGVFSVPTFGARLRGMFFRSIEKTNGHPSISPLTVLSWSRPVPSFDSGVYYPGEGRLYTEIIELFINRTEVYNFTQMI